MAVKLPDTLVPMADFPSAYAKDVQFTDGENLQEKLDNGKLGSSSGGNGLTEEQVNNIDKIPSIEEEVETINSQLDTIENKKADKTTVWTMTNMGQDVKECMTGGSVAVVGKHAILEENLNPNLKENLCMITKSSSYDNKILNSSLLNEENWSTNLATITNISNGEITFKATNKFGNIVQTGLSLTSGRKYYICGQVKTLSTAIAITLVDISGNSLFTSTYFKGTNSWEHKSTVITATKDIGNALLKIVDYSSESFSSVTFTKPCMFDLTEIYGSGNEPTLDEFENYLINNFGDRWTEEIAFFDDTDLKKKITPTIKEVITPLFDTNKKPPIYCTIKDDIINVISKYGENKDICVTLKKKGTNNIFDFYQVKLISNSETSLTTDTTLGTILNTSTTDWHSPFVIRANKNGDGDLPDSYQFTGGNHGYNGGDTGSSTGRTSSIELFVDGKKISDGVAYGYFIEIKWVNYIQASNTKKSDGSGREVLKEIHNMCFNGYEWKSNVELEFLENCYVSTLYGFQASIKNSWDTKVRYVNATNRGVYAGNVDSDSGNKESNKIICIKDNNALSIELDNNYDIGDKRNYTSKKGSFCSSYGKVYFNIANDLNAKAGSYYYRGIYKFYPV